MTDEQDVLPSSPNVPGSEFIYAVNISIAHKYLYVETPKVACTTIKSLLIRAEVGHNFEFSDDERVHQRRFSPLLNPRQVPNFSEFAKSSDIFKFCFVRDPYSRLLSTYLDKVAELEPDGRRDRVGQKIADQLGAESEKRPITFPEFVKIVVQQPIDLMDPHWRVQYYQTFQGTLRYDFTGRFETFTEDLRFVCDKIGIDFDNWYRREAPHATSATDRLGEFYNHHLRQLVYSKYRIDFEHFGYPA